MPTQLTRKTHKQMETQGWKTSAKPVQRTPEAAVGISRNYERSEGETVTPAHPLRPRLRLCHHQVADLWAPEHGCLWVCKPTPRLTTQERPCRGECSPSRASRQGEQSERPAAPTPLSACGCGNSGPRPNATHLLSTSNSEVLHSSPLIPPTTAGSRFGHLANKETLAPLVGSRGPLRTGGW